jgi:hypothetical protein
MRLQRKAANAGWNIHPIFRNLKQNDVILQIRDTVSIFAVEKLLHFS